MNRDGSTFNSNRGLAISLISRKLFDRWELYAGQDVRMWDGSLLGADRIGRWPLCWWDSAIRNPGTHTQERLVDTRSFAHSDGVRRKDKRVLPGPALMPFPPGSFGSLFRSKHFVVGQDAAAGDGTAFREREFRAVRGIAKRGNALA